MKKHEFLRELLSSLSALPEIESDKAYAFYAEIIDDSMEDGMSEEEAVAKLGSLDEIVERIVSEIPIATLIKSRVEQKNGRLFMVLLLVLGFPLWFPILTTILCVLLTLFIVFWVVALVLWVLFAASAAAALGSCAGLICLPDIGLRLIFLGSALTCAGCSLALFAASVSVTKQFAYLTNQLWRKIKNSLIKKRGCV